MTSMESRAAVASPTRPWPAEQVELWPLEKLIPYANNPRLHSAADIERIAASILKWGWTNPVLVDEQGVQIAGHGRVAAAARLGLKSIPVIALMQLKVRSMCFPWPPTCLIYLRGRRLDCLQKGTSLEFGLFQKICVCVL